MQGSFLLTRIVTGTGPGCEDSDSHLFPSSDVSGVMVLRERSGDAVFGIEHWR